MTYLADEKRYEKMEYPRCGRSGLCLPKVSLGFWHNFGDNCSRDNMKKLMFTAFDLGITHFDLANKLWPGLRRGGSECRTDSEGGFRGLPG